MVWRQGWRKFHLEWPMLSMATGPATWGQPIDMGATRFLKLGGLELDSRGAGFFLKPPSSYPSTPNFRGLGY